MDDEAVALEAVRRYVWSGMHDAGGDRRDHRRVGLRAGADRSWFGCAPRLARRSSRNGTRRRPGPRSPTVTRLDAVFESLNERGVLALQNAGYTQSDGLSDVSALYHEAGGEQSGIEGGVSIRGRIWSESWRAATCGWRSATSPAKMNRQRGSAAGSSRRSRRPGSLWNGTGRSRVAWRVVGVRWQRRGASA